MNRQLGCWACLLPRLKEVEGVRVRTGRGEAVEGLGGGCEGADGGRVVE